MWIWGKLTGWGVGGYVRTVEVERWRVFDMWWWVVHVWKRSQDIEGLTILAQWTDYFLCSTACLCAAACHCINWLFLYQCYMGQCCPSVLWHNRYLKWLWLYVCSLPFSSATLDLCTVLAPVGVGHSNHDIDINIDIAIHNMAFFNYNTKLIITVFRIATREGSLGAWNAVHVHISHGFSLKNLFSIFRKYTANVILSQYIEQKPC